MTKKLVVLFTGNTSLSISRDEYDSILDDHLTPGTSIESLYEDHEYLHPQIEELVRAILSEFMINGYPNVTVLENEKD